MSQPGSPARRLRKNPRRFSFDAAIRILQHEAGSTHPAATARFRTAPHLAYPGADILAVSDAQPPVVQTSVIGLVGATGVLPRGYTEQVTAATRERSPSLHAFVDMLADRMAAHFGAAGAKYRIARSAEATRLDHGADRISAALLALTGFGTEGLAARLGCGPAPLLHYSGFFAARPRAADRLASLASDWLGRDVQVMEFQGAWLPVPPDQRTALGAPGLGGAFGMLGQDAAIGVRAWDVQGRVVLRVGPLDRAGFAALLPGGPTLDGFVALVRAYLGFETGFAVNLVVAAAEVPALCLDTAAPPRLGWSSWLPGARDGDAAEPIFEAEVVEAASLRHKGAAGPRGAGAGRGPGGARAA